ncbi:hypothetical protein NFI96_000102 [Prochilodus magdalenae]|nr:hypothetical protein NFI96_000102 [Prochilodus magdalenae]
MFREASNNNLDVYTDSVTGFIRKCIEDVVPTKPVRVYPSQKPWLNCEVCAALLLNLDTRRSIRKPAMLSGRPSEQPNVNHTVLPERAPATADSAPHSVSVADVCKAFKRVNIRKAPGPDGIPGRILKVCAHQLAGVFTDIFNLSLSLSVVPACFKLATIVPVPKTARITTLNDWRPVALTSIISKCFEKLNNLSLNVNKTKELIVDFRKQEGVHTPITINGAAVERVSSFKFLGVHITEELTWTEHTTRVVKKAQQRLFFLTRLKRFGMDTRILRTFYTCTVESILTGSINTWYGSCTAIERKALQRVVRTAQYITGVQCLRKTRRILKDSTHPSHCLFSQLPSGRRFRIRKYKAEEMSTPDHGSINCDHPNGDFSYSTQCEFSYNENYQVIASRTALCEASAVWSTKSPTCEVVQFFELTESPHSSMQYDHRQEHFGYHSSSEFTCEEGYTLTGSGSSQLMCEATGQWNDFQITCGAVQCAAFVDSANGTIICSGDSYNSSSNIFSCNDGFHLQGAPEMTCSESAQWSQEVPYYEGVQFSVLTEPFYGSMQYYHPLGRPAYQSSCEFTCEDGYMLTDSSSGQLMFEATGDWNNSRATCEAVCYPVIVDPANGQIICSGDIYTSSNIFSCNDGFHLQGAPELTCSDSAHSYQEVPYYEVFQFSELTEPLHGSMQYGYPIECFGYQYSSEFPCEEGNPLSGSSFSQLTFEATAYWSDSQPTYEAVYCPNIEDPPNGTIICSGDSYNNGSSSFNDGFHLQSAQWGKGMPYCEGVQFSVLTEPFYGSMQYYHPLGYTAYQSSCEDGYMLIDSGSGQLMYEATGDWNNSRATCEVIVDPANGQIICSGDIYNISNIFSCNDGFHLQGAPELTCSDPAHSYQEVPYYEVFQCSELTEPLHGSMQYDYPTECFGYQYSSEFPCEDGNLLTGSSFSQLMCEATAYWSDSHPTYEAVYCPNIEDPANGTIICSGDSYNNDSSSFNDGFYLQSAQWGQGMPYCEGVQFSVLTEPFYGSMQYYHPLGCPAYQSSCEFASEDGYMLTDSSSGQLMYEATGDWNNSRATCEVIVDPANGQIICSGDIYTSSNIFSCNDGFHLQGAPELTCSDPAHSYQEVPYYEVFQFSELTEPLHGSMQYGYPIECFGYQYSSEFPCEERNPLTGSSFRQLMFEATAYGNDSQPTYAAVHCPNIEDPANGTIICSGDSYNNGSSSFNDGFYLQSAQWGQGMPYCEGVQFSVLTEPFYGSMQYYHPLGCPAYQSSCEFTCEDGYMLTDSSSGQLIYEATGDWNNSRATCEVIVDPVNGQIICRGDIYYISNIFSCNDGFHPQGAPELTCSDPAHSYQEVPYYEVVQRCALSEPYHSPMLYNHAVGFPGYQFCSELTCEEGCTLTGSSFSQLMCEATAYWNDSQPTYEAAHCPYIEDTANGTILCSVDSYNNGSSSFNDGFHLQSAQWGQGMPYCEGVQFSILTEPFYGSMQYYHPLGCPAYQSSCEFTCDSSSGQLMYEATGDWNNSRATCEAVCYPVLVDPANGQIICSGDIYTSSNIFSCNDGFHLQRAPELTCYKSAQWSQEVPYCEVLVTSWTYHLPGMTKSWDESKNLCEKNFTGLMVIQNKEQHEYLKRNLIVGYYWIGLRQTNSQWIWQGTGVPLMGNGSWAVGEPNNRNTNENCVEMYIRPDQSTNGLWNDEACKNQKNVLCYTDEPCKEFSVLGNGKVNCSGGNRTFCIVECSPGHPGTWNHTYLLVEALGITFLPNLY